MPAPAKCSHDDSRLTCVDCSKVICSACLVQCPVGFRCGACGGGGGKKKTSGAPPVSFLIVARSLITCGVLGFVFGTVERILDLPFVGVFVCLAAGLMCGRLAAKIVNDHRIGNAVTVTLVFGLLIGMSFTQLAMVFNILIFGIVDAFTHQPEKIVPMLWTFVSWLFNPVAFIVGFWRTSAWRIY